MESGVLLWAHARCIEDLESVGGGREEERGADFGSLTPCLQPGSGKSLWRWRESRPGPLWPRERRVGVGGRGRGRALAAPPSLAHGRSVRFVPAPVSACPGVRMPGTRAQVEEESLGR